MARKLNLRVSDAECKLLLHSLVELRNALIREGRYTDFVDEGGFSRTRRLYRRGLNEGSR